MANHSRAEVDAPGSPVPADATGPVRILLVEDDLPLAELLADYLRGSGFVVEIEPHGARAVARILDERPGLVVLDLMLPGEDGFAVCRRVRPMYAGPILMLTARGRDTDQIEGLTSGADDYVAKPTRAPLLLARIAALLRRAPPAEPAWLSRAGLVLDARVRTASARGRRLELSRAEFDLLWLLTSHAGQALPRKVIFERLRGLGADDFDRSIDLRVSRLRQKIAAACGVEGAIRTVRGIGYELVGVAVEVAVEVAR
jgi:two-component system response regulator RstA